MAIESMRIRLLADQPRGKRGDEIVVRKWEGERMIADGSGEEARNDQDTSNAAPVETGNDETNREASRNRTADTRDAGTGSSRARAIERGESAPTATPEVQATSTTKGRVAAANARSKARKAKRQ